MKLESILLPVAVSAVITFSLRYLPFFVFRGNRTLPEWLDRLGLALPPTIMAVLIIYCLRDIPSDWIGVGIPKLAAVAVVAFSYHWKHNTLLSILLGTACHMVLLKWL
jgi:branched-subunit amino acid transport protein AzlD